MQSELKWECRDYITHKRWTALGGEYVIRDLTANKYTVFSGKRNQAINEFDTFEEAKRFCEVHHAVGA